MKIVDDLKELLNKYKCVNLNYIEACGYECNITKERFIDYNKNCAHCAACKLPEAANIIQEAIDTIESQDAELYKLYDKCCELTALIS